MVTKKGLIYHFHEMIFPSIKGFAYIGSSQPTPRSFAKEQ